MIKEICIFCIMFVVLFFKNVYLLSSIYGYSSILLLLGLISLVPLVFIFAIISILFKKTRIWAFLGFSILLSLLFFIDVLYVRAFGQLVSFFVIFSNGITEDLTQSIVSLIKWHDIFLYLDIPVLVLLICRRKSTNIQSIKVYWIVIASITFILMIQHFQTIENNMLLGNYRKLPLLMSPVGNHFYDAYRFIYERNSELTEEERREIKEWQSKNKKYLEPDPTYLHLGGLLKGRNLIVIQFESIETILIKSRMLGLEITPNINRILEESIYFPNIVEQVKDGNSSDAELIFNTSMYPIKDGSAFLRFGQNDYNSFPLLLKPRGYTSIAIHGDNKEFWNRNIVFPNLGYQKYVDETQFLEKMKVGMGILDEHLFSQAIHEIENLGEPFNVFLITITSHMPFDMPEKYWNPQFLEKTYTTQYLNSIHYVDRVFGDFYNKLKENGIMERSLLVIYGDHEGIHKYYSTELPDNDKKTPLIIHTPGLNGIEIDKIGGQVDIMPTLLYLMGVDVDAFRDTVMGRNLFGKFSGSAVLLSGEAVENVDDLTHLRLGIEISNMSIRGNYYGSKEWSK